MRNSLRIRLTIMFIGLAVGPLLLVGLILVQRSFTVEREQALDLQAQVAQRVSTELEAFLQEVENDFHLLGREIRDLEQADRAQQMSLLLGAFSIGTYRDVYEGFTLLDSQGQEQLRLSRQEIISPDELGDRSGAAEFEQPKASGKTYFSPVWFDPKTGKPLMTIAIPLSERRSVQVNAVLVADLRFKRVGDLISRLQVSEGQTIYVVDRAGQVVAHQDASVALQDLRFEAPEQGGTQTGLDGTDVVLGIDNIRLDEQGLTIVAERPVSEALESAINTTVTIVATIVGALVIAGGLGFFVVRQIVRPVEAMSATAQAISAGDLSQQVAVSSRDELGILAGAFNSMTTQLRGLIGTLEDQVRARTAELVLSMEVGQQAAAIRELDELIPTITELIREKFDLYYTHVYFLDDLGQNLVIKAGTGPVGQELLARRHSLPIGPGSIVGLVAAEGKSIVVPDTEMSDIHKPNPLLPKTRSELAVALIVEGQVIGVLDMQADQVNAFTEENLTVFEALATQLAIAIDSAQQWAVAQEAQRKSEEAIKRLTRETWAEKLARERKEFGFAYNLSTITPVVPKSGEPPANDLSATLLVQNQPIGQLTVAPPAGHVWSESEQELVAAVAQQLAQKAENLRLFEETEQRATREQITRQITDKMRTSPDVDTIIQTGLTELAKALGVPRTYVKLSEPSKTKELSDGQSTSVPKSSQDGKVRRRN